VTPEAPGGPGRSGTDPGRPILVDLRTAADGGFELDAGGRLPELTIAYETWGVANADRSNGVLVLHALTGDSHAASGPGPDQAAGGWWEGLIGPGAAIDTDRYFVVCPNVLGGCQGSSGPATRDPDGKRYGARFPLITIRDQVAAEVALADHLGIDQWAGVVGGSMGGMRVLEWLVGFPDRVRRAVVLAVGAAATADQLALCSLQVRAIRNDPAFVGGDYYGLGAGPVEGLAIARGIGQFSYRTAQEFQNRFGHAAQAEEDPLKGGRFAVESYLEHHGAKLVGRFDANSYIVLSEAMNTHDIGRGRGGVERALSRVRAGVTLAGIDTDRLYPLELQQELGRSLPGHPSVEVVESVFGHDGFLLEVEQVGAIVSSALQG
jgi:homoserine O-acetyltransferase